MSENAALTTMPDWLKGALAQFMNNPAYDLVLPSIPAGEPGYGMKPSVCVVQLSGDPDAKEVFKVGARGGADLLALTKAGLERMADAAGITIRTRRTDDRKDPDYCEFEAVGMMKNAQGQDIIRSGTAGIRVSQWREDRRTELMEQAAKWNKPTAGVESALNVEMAQFRKHFISRTETKAVLRVIRSFLAIKSGVTRAEVEKPKVLVRMTFQPDMSDPDVKRAVIAKALGASALAYGPTGGGSFAEAIETAPAALPPAAEVVTDDEREPGEVETAASGVPAGKSAMEQVVEGCRILGLDPDALVEECGGVKKALAELNRRANAA